MDEPAPEPAPEMAPEISAEPSPERGANAWILPFVWVIRGYQRWVSPMLGPSCRFSPTCSHYAVHCLCEHGLIRGGWLSMRRVARCHPFHPGGYDPPPPRLRAREAASNPLGAPEDSA